MPVPDDDAPFPEPVEIAISEEIDLHRFRPSEVVEVVEAYLEAAVEAGFRRVRIVHGRGRGVQRARVRRALERSAAVEHFEDAPGAAGGWGATVVRLHLHRGDVES
jgi:dsDNA-specific endonuclease/ATPase MutS2